MEEFDRDELRLIAEAVDYLLGADLTEENGWTDSDIDTLEGILAKTDKYRDI